MWGSNGYGQLGNNSTTDSYVPIKIMDDVVSISLGDNHSAAIKSDGSLWMWGNNIGGQLGNGSTNNSTVPIKIMDNVMNVDLGIRNTAVIKADNSLWTWGDNMYSQLGYDTTSIENPKPKQLMENVVSVSMGCMHSAAITSDGSLYTWGSNHFAQLGIGKDCHGNIPRKIMSDVRSIDMGMGMHGIAVKNDDSLWVWGGGAYPPGTLSIGDTSHMEKYGTPRKILNDICFASAGADYTLALNNSSGLYAFGDNDYGQLGTGTKIDNYIPFEIMDDVKLPNTKNTTPYIPKLDFPSSSSIVLGDLPETLYVHGANNVSFTVDNNNIISIQPTSLAQLGAKQAVSAVWVTGKTPGTATITATAPDGRTAQCVVTVTGKIAETISDEMILKARVVQNNQLYQWMSTSMVPPDVIIYNELDDSIFWKVGVVNATKTLVEQFDRYVESILEQDASLAIENYYEVALMQMIASNGTWAENVVATIDESAPQFISIVKDLSDSSNGNKTTFTKNLQDKLFDDSDWTNVECITAGLSAINATDEEIRTLYTLQQTSEEFRTLLELLRDNTDIPYLKKACSNLLGRIDDACEKTLAEVTIDGFSAGGKDLASAFIQGVWDATIDSVPVLSAAKKMVEGGRLVSNVLFSSDTISNNILTMCGNIVIEAEMKQIMVECENQFQNNETARTAQNFVTSAIIYKSLMLHSCDLSIKYMQDLKSAKIQNSYFSSALEIFKLISDDPFITQDDIENAAWRIVNSTDVSGYDRIISDLGFIKTRLEGISLFSSLDDISQYIRSVVSTTPSEWAKPYIDKAINYNLLPEEYQNNYHNNITRTEFCTLLSCLLRAKTNEDFYEIANRLGRPKIMVQFDDVLYPDVSQIAMLGIINGTGNNKFEPLGEITREQAAKMLCETAKVLEYDTSASQTNLSGVSEWAKEGTNFVVAYGIMTGTDKGFEPQGTYTKEQAITTMVRFYENLN